jgi:pyrophosphatase PpaX
MKQYDYILFDWDGCLAQTLEVWLDAYRSALARRGIVASDSEVAHYLGDYEIGKYFNVGDVESFNIESVSAARHNLKKVELYDGVKELLLELKKTKKLALVSSGSRDIIATGLAHNGIEHMFDVVIVGEDVIEHKPHPESLEKALSALNGDKEHSIMVGDSNKDLGAAINFGIDSVLVFPDSHGLFYDITYLKSLSPTYMITHFDQLKAILG